MKEQLELMVQNINRILKDENSWNDWYKGRHSALKGVRKELKEILTKSSERKPINLDKQSKEVCLHLLTYCDEDGFQRCQKCDEIVD